MIYLTRIAGHFRSCAILLCNFGTVETDLRDAGCLTHICSTLCKKSLPQLTELGNITGRWVIFACSQRGAAASPECREEHSCPNSEILAGSNGGLRSLTQDQATKSKEETA